MGGRQELIKAGLQALDDLDVLDLSVIFQELVRAGLNGLLKSSDAGACVQEILKELPATIEVDSEKIDGPLLFLDSFSIIAEAEPYHAGMKYILAASGVSPELMRQNLETQVLEKAGLVKEQFAKRGIRIATNILYRQSNHNLLREETEGFAKLFNELYSTSEIVAREPNESAVEGSFERVKGLIGTFDLDVGRTLDIFLDLMASSLIKRYQFFVKFLRISSWWPREYVLAGNHPDSDSVPKWILAGSGRFQSTDHDREALAALHLARDNLFWDRAREIGMDAFYELGGRQPVDAATKQQILAARADDDDADHDWIEATGTLPPKGNRTAAQLLGFKMRFYASPARDKGDTMPENLVFLAALLIKIGFISLRDLYPHLHPLDEDMAEYKVKEEKEMLEKEKASRPGGGTNALMMAGALADDTVPTTGRSREMPGSKTESAGAAITEPENEKLPDCQNQKVVLLVNLLTIGALPESLFILGRFPWIADVEPKVHKLLHRMFIHQIENVFQTTRLSSQEQFEIPQKDVADLDQTGVARGSVRLTKLPRRHAVRWPYPDKFDEGESGTYKFYWDEWSDAIPICQSVDDIFTLCDTLLNLSGVNIGSNSELLSKLASIGNKSLAEDPSEANLKRWQDLLKRLLVPALSHTHANTNLVNEIYDMLRYYPTSVRYSIYAEWFEGATSRLPAMMKVVKRAELETLATMKRISKTNISPSARALAKTAYANPGVVFRIALGQIESYSNLTDVVVECAKYFTDLGYDVLIWSLMSSLGKQTRNRTQSHNALLTSKWLLALANFAGKVFKRFSIMNPAPILQYVNHQLYRGNSTDLIILQELIKQMCGVVPDTDFTDAQLLALTGGPVLRKQTLISLQDRRYESEKTSKRLLKSLTETRLAGQLLVAIAQHRQISLFRVPDDEAFIKYLSTMVDETQTILMQFLDLLRSSLTVEEFDDLVPNTLDLISQFGLDPSLAFAIGRATYTGKLAASAAPKKLTNGTAQSSPVSSTDGDVEMGTAGGDTAKEPSAEVTNGDVSMADTTDIPMVDGPSDTPSVSAGDSWNDVLQPLIESVQTILPEKPWKLLSPEFYVTFWQLTLADIQVPMDSYTIENARLTKEMQEVSKDRTLMAAVREAKRKELDAIKENVLNESKDQMGQYSRNRACLNQAKKTWFSNDAKPDTLTDALIEECLLPRMLLSPSDADYVFEMIKFLHKSGTPHFRTLSLFVRIFKPHRLRAVIFSCTIREAECFARFLRSLLGELSRWHADKATFEKEAWGSKQELIGFAKKVNKDGKPEGDLLDHEEFRRVLHGWHKSLFTALKTCLGGDEWMQIRNAITVLKVGVDFFPAIDFMGKQFIMTLENIVKREKEHRSDLSLLASAALPGLHKRLPKLLLTQAFANNIVSVPCAHEQAISANKHQGDGPQTNGKASPASSKPAEMKTVLMATAPDFKPASASSLNANVENEATDSAKGDKYRGAPLTAAPARGPAADANRSANRGRTDSFGSGNLPPRHSGRQEPSNLPIRPDGPLPPLPRGGNVDRHLPSRGADRRDAHSQRLDRPSGAPSWRSADNAGVDRGIDRGVPDRRDLTKPGPSERPNPRDRFNVNRSADPFTESRQGAHGSRRERISDVNAAKPRDEPARPGPEPVREPPINPERLAQIEPNVAPARAAAIHGSLPARTASPRGHRDEKPHSRGPSPRRGDRQPSGHGSALGQQDARQDSRQQGRMDRIAAPLPPVDSWSPTHDKPSSRDAPPQLRGRGDARNDSRTGERLGRDAFRPVPPMPQVDPDHGRLNQPSRQDDANFGRLSAAPENAIPSGPRGQGRGRDQKQGQNMPRNDGRLQQPQQQPNLPRPPSPGRDGRREIIPPTGPSPPPTGPAADRGGRERRSDRPDSSHSQPQGQQQQPPAPAAAPAALPVHPSRIPQLPAEVRQVNPAAHNAPPPGLHPSRHAEWHRDNQQSQQAQNQNVNQRNGPQGAPPSVQAPINSAPPSGPRGQHNGAPTTPGVTSGPTGGVPTGPSGRDGRNAHARMFGGIQDTLKAAGRGDDRRGRGSQGPPGNMRGRGGQGMVADQFGGNANANMGGNVTAPPPVTRDPRPQGRRDLGPEPTGPPVSGASRDGGRDPRPQGRRDLGPEPTGPPSATQEPPRHERPQDDRSGRSGAMRDFDRRERGGRGSRSGHASRDRTPERHASRDLPPPPPIGGDGRDVNAGGRPDLRMARSENNLRDDRNSGRERRSSARGDGRDGGESRNSDRSGRSSAMGVRNDVPGGPPGAPGSHDRSGRNLAMGMRADMPARGHPGPPGAPPVMHMQGPPPIKGDGYGPGPGGRDSRGGMRDDRRASGRMDDHGDITPGSDRKRRGDDRMDRGREKRARQA